MCVIIDANLASAVFSIPANGDFRPVLDWIDNQGGKLVFGGRNALELLRVGSAARRIREWASEGKAHQESAARVDAKTAEIESSGDYKSDDPHIIALAELTRTRLLCSMDRDLHSDFTTILIKPKGKVYQNAAHRRLLRHTPGCIGSRKR